MSIITVKNLQKNYTYHEKGAGLLGSIQAFFFRKKLQKKALKGLNFTIKKGEFIGFIGPNGAGKTTTLKILSGILYPSSGQVKVCGFIPQKRQNKFKQKISILMGQKYQILPEIPPFESFDLIRTIYSIPKKTFQKRLNYFVELLDLKDKIYIQARKLSLGERMKCEIIAALLHDPAVLFLDEPTIGLDVNSQKRIRKFLKEYNKKSKTTIILTSHYMADVEDLCQRLIIINEGSIGYDGATQDIIKKFSNEKIVKLSFNKHVFKKDLAPYGKIIKYNSSEVELSIDSQKSQEILQKILKKLPVKDFSINNITLEEIVSKLFEQEGIKVQSTQ